MRSILITGCNRGLGLGLVRSLVRHNTPPEYLIATCRDLEKAHELQDIAKENPSLHILELDVRNYDTFKDFSERVANIVKDNGLNCLFNNAGVSPKYTRIQYVKSEQLLDTFATNTVAPIMLTKALLPLLQKASENNIDEEMGIKKAAVVNMSSILGSLSLNTAGGLYPYKCSKAALNMATSSMSVDLQRDEILVTALHPGWVKTNMGGTNATMEVENSADSLVKLLYSLSEKHNGGYYQWDGKRLPW